MPSQKFLECGLGQVTMPARRTVLAFSEPKTARVSLSRHRSAPHWHTHVSVAAALILLVVLVLV